MNGKQTPSPQAFVKAIEDIPDRQYFPVLWYDMREFRNMDALETGFKQLDSHWLPVVTFESVINDSDWGS